MSRNNRVRVTSAALAARGYPELAERLDAHERNWFMTLLHRITYLTECIQRAGIRPNPAKSGHGRDALGCRRDRQLLLAWRAENIQAAGGRRWSK
jgi:hypothetical protein